MEGGVKMVLIPLRKEEGVIVSALIVEQTQSFARSLGTTHHEPGTSFPSLRLSHSQFVLLRHSALLHVYEVSLIIPSDVVRLFLVLQLFATFPSSILLPSSFPFLSFFCWL